MGITRRESRAWRAKHERILAAALDEFIANGFDGASMDGIALRAKVSKVTIYNHFKNKEELYNQVLDVHLTHLAAVDYGADLVGCLPPEEALTRFGRRLLDVFLLPKTIGVTRLLAIDVFRRGTSRKEVAFATAARRLPEHARLCEYLDRESVSGRLRIPQTELAARQFVGMLFENTFNRRLWGFDIDDSEQALGGVIRASVQVFLEYYGVKTPLPGQSPDH